MLLEKKIRIDCLGVETSRLLAPLGLGLRSHTEPMSVSGKGQLQLNRNCPLSHTTRLPQSPPLPITLPAE